MQYKLRVNGKTHSVDVDPDTPLLWVLRDELGLTGTKYGCGRAQCGACTVHVEGQPRRSCVLPISALEDNRVVTIEGLDTAAGQAVEEAWNRLDVPQCGFCQSGQVMSAAALLAAIPNPGDAEIDGAMAGNICRCATYDRIRQAIREAASGGEEA
jgi:isoquinoline 1-oxidoreductase alpha subunit